LDLSDCRCGFVARTGGGDLGSVAAVGLGGVERSVGAADELIAVAGVIGDLGDTEARGVLVIAPRGSKMVLM
jgi:hypothetical protein